MHQTTIDQATATRAANLNCGFEATLLAIAGHDLRQPLQIIQNVHDRLGDAARTQPELHLLHLGQSAIDRLAGQLNQLLRAMVLHRHVNEVRLTPVAVGPLIEDARRDNEWLARQRKVRIRQVATCAWVLSDNILLGAAVRNVINNAVKYTEPGGQILLGCRQMGDSVRIDVIDTGIGISDEHMTSIFDAFTRLDTVQSDGMGIGLFIVQQAAAQLGHRLAVESAVSRGTRISIIARRA